jgi:hypothetical protein
VADEDDVATGLDLTLGLTVDFGHQRAGGVQPFKAAFVRDGGIDLGTPWAEKMTGAPSGTSSSSSTKIAPFSFRPSTT